MSDNDVTREPASPTGEAGLQRGLKNRHIQLIALGGAIGTGLFYGAGGSISLAGPAVLLLYLIAGIVIFFVMRALGEMSVDTPVSGAFSYYAYKNWGELPGFFSGWNYWFNYIAVSMAELVVVGTYIQFWFPQIPLWVSSLVFLLIITGINLISVKAYGECEFWFAIIKVVAILAMIVFGLIMIIFGVGGHTGGISNLWVNGGFFPTGPKELGMAMVMVLFSFGGVELIGITAGEADNPGKSIPKAINQVVYRILIFYIGSIFVMLALFPWNQLDPKQSPFVEIFSKLGIASAATILNIVVLTAAVSAYNSGLYCNGRMLKALAEQGNAPKALAKVNKAGSPYVGVLVSSCVTAVAVLLVFLMPDAPVFLYVISVALAAGIFNWIMIMITQLKFRKRIGAEGVSKLKFKLPLYPVINYVVIAFLLFVYVLMAFTPDYKMAATVVGPIWIVLLIVAFYIKKSVTSKHADTTNA